MKARLSLGAELGRPAYAIASIAVFFSQHLFAWLAFAVAGEPLATPWWFWLNPLRAMIPVGTIFSGPQPPVWLPLTAMAAVLVADGALVALAFRRAARVRGGEGLAALAVAPGLQVLIILWFCLAPERRPAAPPEPTSPSPSAARSVALGMLTGVAICVGAVLISAVVLRTYGYGLFIASPFVIGLATAYVANRKGDLGVGRTLMLVCEALGLGGVALLGFALEGVICLLFASPLIAAMGVMGGLLGRALARLGRPGRGTTMMSIAVLPLLLGGEVVLPPRAGFESIESIEVAAPPMAVWDSVVHMGPIPGAPAAPFRWGLAYPMRGEIMGAGVGAIRRGVFSTGVAYERVTEWTPGRRLSFIVLSDPPTMRELSPYAHVNAPHVNGYFRTLDARFTITPLQDGRTKLTLATRHELDLEPALYWIPLAEWATHANKRRVLDHFRDQAEGRATAVPRS